MCYYVCGEDWALDPATQGFPRGEAVERSETDEARGRKSGGFTHGQTSGCVIFLQSLIRLQNCPQANFEATFPQGKALAAYFVFNRLLPVKKIY